MSRRADIILRRVRPLGGALGDVAIKDGLIWQSGSVTCSGPELDGAGAQLFPGLIDHHVHLLATAARMRSLDLHGLTTQAELVSALRAHAETLPVSAWVRAVNYDERAAGLPDADQLADWLPHHKLRMQDRTGALWLLNRQALADLGQGPFPSGVAVSADGRPSGVIRREDGWLRSHLPQETPDLSALSRQGAAWGLTGFTDAGAGNGAEEARLLSDARQSGALLQRLCLMGTEDLPESVAFARGPLKLLYDDANLPDLDDFVARIRTARAQGRAVAAHCVTVAELALFLAALDAAGGGRWGDRVEHGGLIPADFIPELRRHRLTVVTQPDFIRTRGDRYRAEIDRVEWPDLYRLGSLARAGVAISVGSDAPYGSCNPWEAIRSGMNRTTKAGNSLGSGEALPPQPLLAMFGGTFQHPSQLRTLDPGQTADLVLLDEDWAEQLRDEAAVPVKGTWIDGRCRFGVGL